MRYTHGDRMDIGTLYCLALYMIFYSLFALNPEYMHINTMHAYKYRIGWRTTVHT